MGERRLSALPEVTLQEIVAALGGDLHGDPSTRVNRLSPVGQAGAGALAFVSHLRYAKALEQTQATALIVPPALVVPACERGPAIETPDPYLYYALLTQWWRQRRDHGDVPAQQAAASVHPSAVVDSSAVLEAGVRIGPFACVGAHAYLGPGVVIGPHVTIEEGAWIGEQTQLKASVVLGAGCRIGARGLVHAGTVIGADGFGFAPSAGRWVKIEQLGAVCIGDDVEIGANCCIDRGALEDTVIGDGVKLDNLIQIGHNVVVGDHTAMAGCVGVAGSAHIGSGCTIGGGAVVLGHLTLADGVHISAASVVMRSIHRPGQYSGVFPIDENTQWEKNAATLRQLYRLRERLKALENKS